MSKLCINLPPYSPDYSGCASALFELGGMIVLHDASGCTGNYLGYDEPRWMGSKSIVFCSGLRHMDAILGNDNLLIDRIIKAAESLKPRFIALLGSPVPMVIGADYEGIMREVEERTGIPSFGFDTKGLAYYGKGISMAVIALIKKFCPKERVEESGRKGINLIGLTPLDFGNKGVEKDFIRLFENAGITVNCSFSTGHSIEAIQNSVKSKLNVVVSQSGIEVAKFMEEKFGIPYLTGTPVGEGKSILSRVKEILAGGGEGACSSEKSCEGETACEGEGGCCSEWEKACEGAGPGSGSLLSKKVLVAGDQIISRSICQEAERIHPGISFVSGTIFDFSGEEARTGDIFIRDESTFRKIVNSGDYAGIVSDPLVEELLTEEAKKSTKFFALPNVAVSSKVYWNDTINILGEEMSAFIAKITV